MAFDDRKVRFVVTRLSPAQQQPNYLQTNTNTNKTIGTSSVPIAVNNNSKGVVHGTRQYVNGTLVTENEDPGVISKTPPPTTTNGHLKTVPLNLPSKRSNNNNKPPEATAACESLAPLKSSIMKKSTTTLTPSAANKNLPTSSPVLRPKTNREPFEVRKLVTFTDLIQYEDDFNDEKDVEASHMHKGLHSEGDLQRMRLIKTGSTTEKKSKIVSRSKMISSISAPDIKSFNKLKGIKNVGPQQFGATKSFCILPEPQLPLFVESNNNINAVDKTNADKIPVLPVININLIPHNQPPPNQSCSEQDERFLKVPKLKAIPNASNNNQTSNSSSASGSGTCGCDFDDNSTSFRVFDRTLSDGSVQSFHLPGNGSLKTPNSDSCSDLPALDVQSMTIDEDNLVQFWRSVEKWQNIHREQQLVQNRMGYDNVLFLNNLRNELLMTGQIGR